MNKSVDDNDNSNTIAARNLLRQLKAGRARLVESGGSFRLLLAAGETRQVPSSLVGELVGARLLRPDGQGGLRLQAAEEDGESPLFRLRHRKDGKGRSYLSAPQFEAGERLRADYERADLAPRLTANWSGERVDSSSHASLSDNRISHLADSAFDARRRVHAAFDAVGPELAAVLYYVCCLAGGLEQAERFLTLPPRSGKAILSLALTRLARHYRLLVSPETSAKARDVGHWALADYRPVIPPRQPPAHQT